MRLLKDLGMILSVTLILAGCTTSFPPPPLAEFSGCQPARAGSKPECCRAA